jgi:fructose-1,6-bisphosphatase/inositol monophosphatase family enzyme
VNNQLINEIKQMVQSAYEAVLNNKAFEVHDKGKQDIVTDLDFAMERRIKEAIKALFPDDRFIGEEENHETLGMARTWVCDPIDGTLNFTQNIPYYGIQLALLVKKEPMFSLIFLPQLKEMYYAVKGQGAYMGDTKLKLDSMLPLSKTIVTFGDFSKSNPSSRGYQLKAIAAMVERAMRVRIQGASSVDFAFVASGKNGCHIIFSKNIWELAPGTMLAAEAGCKVYSLSGERHGFSGEGLVIAGNEVILNEVVTILEQLL